MSRKIRMGCILMTKFSFNVQNISDDEIMTYLNQRNNITVLSFVSPYSGIPHMCPVWGVFINGKFFFQTEDYSFKVKFIKKGNDKIGVSIVDPSLFPDYSESSIPYISLGGTATIRTKDEFEDFEKVIAQIFLKYIEDKEERIKVSNFVLNEVKSRILVEVNPEWIKAIKVPS